MTTFFPLTNPLDLAPASSEYGRWQRVTLAGATVGTITTIAGAIFESTPNFVLGLITTGMAFLAFFAFRKLHILSQPKSPPLSPVITPIDSVDGSIKFNATAFLDVLKEYQRFFGLEEDEKTNTDISSAILSDTNGLNEMPGLFTQFLETVQSKHAPAGWSDSDSPKTSGLGESFIAVEKK